MVVMQPFCQGIIMVLMVYQMVLVPRKIVKLSVQLSQLGVRMVMFQLDKNLLQEEKQKHYRQPIVMVFNLVQVMHPVNS